MHALAPVSDKLSKLLPRLASPHDGEVVATARAIGRTLEGAGLDFHTLAAAVTTPPVPVYPTFRPATPKARPAPRSSGFGAKPAGPTAIRAQQLANALFCRDADDRLKDNEAEFIRGIIGRLSSGKDLSEKQAKWLEDIHRRLLGVGR